MNQQVKREGFVSDAAAAEPPIVDVSPQDAQEEARKQAAEWPVKVKLLHKAINNGREQVNELTFREPTGGDINRYGNPVRIDQYGEVIIDERKMMTMIAVLSGILQPFIEGMDTRDWNSCAYRLRRFFLPDLSAW